MIAKKSSICWPCTLNVFPLIICKEKGIGHVRVFMGYF